MASAASALRYWERRQEVAAHNLANVSTDGFKAERVFARMIDDALPVADTATDLSGGTLKPSGAPLDLALEGPGFFVVGTEGGERWSRGGSFRLDEAGQVVDASGNALLGEDGPVTVPAGGAVAIDREGVVRVDGKEVAKLRVETSPPGVRLAHEAGTLFVPDAGRAPAQGDARQVRQGFTEESNVSSVGSLVDMISVQRAYASVQKAVTTLDGIRQTISTELGKPV
ncbi:MAG TPA: flagellar hook-basal body protein [Longimicrobiaceae bacterium]